MKCPHCFYEPLYTEITAPELFYRLSQEMIQEGAYPATLYLYGCPKCKKAFIA